MDRAKPKLQDKNLDLFSILEMGAIEFHSYGAILSSSSDILNFLLANGFDRVNLKTFYLMKHNVMILMNRRQNCKKIWNF